MYKLYEIIQRADEIKEVKEEEGYHYEEHYEPTDDINTIRYEFVWEENGKEKILLKTENQEEMYQDLKTIYPHFYKEIVRSD